jgi:hypothetical protein
MDKKEKEPIIIRQETIYEALVAAQGEITNVAKDVKGHNYMYADLPSVLDMIRPILLKHSLFVTQLVNDDEGRTFLTTKLYHSSGECLESKMPLYFENLGNARNAWQERGSAITYARRYAITALLGIAADEDIDAKDLKEEKAKPCGQQLNKLKCGFNKLAQYQQTEVLAFAQIKSIDDVTLDKFTAVVNSIEKKIKAISNGE